MRFIALAVLLVAVTGTARAGGVDNLVFLNEIYASHAGTDDMEFIELIGPEGTSLDHYMVLIVEGDGANAGILDRAWDLTGTSFGATNTYFVLGDTGVVPTPDFDLGSDNNIENGTETIYLVDALNDDGVATILALLTTDVSTGDDTTMIPGLSIVLDIVGMADDEFTEADDRIYDGAEVVGPEGNTFFPPGIYRGEDHPAPWCSAFLDFDDEINLLQPRTPAAQNSPCYILDIGASCNGSGDIPPRLQVRGDPAPGGELTVGVYDGLGGSTAVFFVSRGLGDGVNRCGCTFLLGTSFGILGAFSLSGIGDPGTGSVELIGIVPAAATPGEVYFQAFVVDAGANPCGYSGTNATEVEIP